MFVASSNWQPIWKFWNIKHSINLTSHMTKWSQIMSTKFFLWCWRHRWRHRVASKFLPIFMFRRGWHREQIARAMSINANIIIVFLGYACQKTISMNNTCEIASQRSTSQAYWVTLALMSNIANYLKHNNYYFWDCYGIDDVTLWLWKFSDFCSPHIVGIAGDDIMFHILVLSFLLFYKSFNS